MLVLHTADVGNFSVNYPLKTVHELINCHTFIVILIYIQGPSNPKSGTKTNSEPKIVKFCFASHALGMPK